MLEPATTLPAICTQGPEIATYWAARGFRVLPVQCPILGDKKSGKRPIGLAWWIDAQTQESLNKAAYQDRNVGIAGGYPLPGGGYLVVLDCDGAEGIENLRTLASRSGGLPRTFTVQSGSGQGLHLYFRSRKVCGGHDLFRQSKINVRGQGGQVVAPGCVHYTGGLYGVTDDVEVAWAPEWLEQQLQEPGPAAPAPGTPAVAIETVHVTREMCAQRALEIGPNHLAYDVFLALGKGTPLAAKGDRHEVIDLRAAMVCVDAWYGISDSSFLELVSPSYPEWVRTTDGRLTAGMAPEKWYDALRGLNTARNKVVFIHAQEKLRSNAATALYQTGVVSRGVPDVSPIKSVVLAPVLDRGSVAPTSSAGAQARAVDSAVSAPALTDLRLTLEHCRTQSETIGRKTANGAAQRKRYWKQLAFDVMDLIQIAELPDVLRMVFAAYPTATAASILDLLAPHNIGTAVEVLGSINTVKEAFAHTSTIVGDVLDLYKLAGVRITDEGVPVESAANCQKIIRAQMGKAFRLNVRRQAVEVQDNKIGWRNLQDTDYSLIIEWLQDTHSVLKPSRIPEAVDVCALGNECDPFVDMLEALPQWDRTPRLKSLLHKGVGAPDNAYTRAVGAKFMVSIVARAYAPGCKVDTKIVLVGKQGKRKSTWFQTLVGAQFFDSTPRQPGETGKDYLLRLHGCVLHEDAELDTYSKTEVKADKAFLSNQVDALRPPYGRSTRTMPRRFVVCGSTNEEDGFLRDPTGGRRYWPVTIGAIDLAWTKAHLTQLWAEARELYRSWVERGSPAAECPWWLTDAEDVDATAEQEAHSEHDDMREAQIAKLVTEAKPSTSGVFQWREQFDQSERLIWVTQAQLAEVLTGTSTRVIGAVLKSMGWVKLGTRFDRLPNGAKAQRWVRP